MNKNGIGAALKRKEDPRLITGSATYTDDIQLPGMLYAQFVRSPYAHARLSSVDGAAALALPGVVGVYTFDTLKDYFKAPLPCAWAAYPLLKNPAHWPLANGIARHVGEPVAVVLAESRHAAADAADQVMVEYAELPAVVDLEEALRPDAPRVHADLENNISFTFDHVTSGVAEAFKQADVVVRQRHWQQRLIPNAIEPRAVVTEWRRHSGEMTLWSATQVPHFLKIFASVLLGIPEHQFRVVAPEVGGGFGSKLQVYSEEIVCGALAMATNRPVKWTMNREEEFVSTHHGREGYIDVEFAARRDGTLTGIRLNWVSDMGAYNMLNGPYVPILGFIVSAGPYQNKEMEAHITGVFTNKTGTDAYRGAGRPEATHFLERTMDRLADELGLDPAEVRRKNLIRPEQFPFTTATGLTYDSGDYHLGLDKALQAADYAGWRAEQAGRRKAGGKQIGIGLCTYIEACGLAPSAATAGSFYGAALWDSAEVRVHHTGKVTVFTGASAHGQGHETAWSQIVSEQLGIDPADVDVVHGDTARGPLGTNTYGSRSLVVSGVALFKALERVKDKVRLIAAHKLECAAADLDFGDSKVFVKGSPDRALAFAEVAVAANLGFHSGMPAGMEPGLEATAFFSPENFSFPAGAHICITEVDPETGKVEILKYVAVDDCGTIVNPLIAEGQVHGGIAQGIAQALFEELRYSSDGQPQGASLMEYGVPTAADLPHYDTQFIATPATSNPLGAKGIGEAGTIASTVAVVNSVVDALRPLGVKHIDMPCTAPRVWRAIAQAKGE